MAALGCFSSMRCRWRDREVRSTEIGIGEALLSTQEKRELA